MGNRRTRRSAAPGYSPGSPSSPRSLIERPPRRSPATACRRLRGGAARCPRAHVVRPGLQALHAHPVRPAGLRGRDGRRQGHDRGPRVRGQAGGGRGAARQPGVLQRRRRRSGRLPGPHVRPVRRASRADRQVARAHPQAGLRGADGPDLQHGRAQPDPRVRLRLSDPRGRRHVGAHARQRRRRRRVPGRGRDPHRRRRRRDRDPPHHRRGLHRRRHGRLRRQQGARPRGRRGQRGRQPAGVRRRHAAHPLRGAEALHLRDVHQPGQRAAGRHQPRAADRLLPRHAGRAPARRGALRLGLGVRRLLAAGPGLPRAHQDAARSRPCAAPRPRRSTTTAARPTSSASGSTR